MWILLNLHKQKAGYILYKCNTEQVQGNVALA